MIITARRSPDAFGSWHPGLPGLPSRRARRRRLALQFRACAGAWLPLPRQVGKAASGAASDIQRSVWAIGQASLSRERAQPAVNTARGAIGLVGLAGSRCMRRSHPARRSAAQTTDDVVRADKLHSAIAGITARRQWTTPDLTADGCSGIPHGHRTWGLSCSGSRSRGSFGAPFRVLRAKTCAAPYCRPVRGFKPLGALLGGTAERVICGGRQRRRDLWRAGRPAGGTGSLVASVWPGSAVGAGGRCSLSAGAGGGGAA